MLRVMLLIVVSMVMMSTVGVYAGSVDTSGDQTVVSSSTEPLGIGWRLTTGQIDGVKVAWTPASASVYTIAATTGGITSTIQVGPTGTSRRTDIVPISPVDAHNVNTVNVTIVEEV